MMVDDDASIIHIPAPPPPNSNRNLTDETLEGTDLKSKRQRGKTGDSIATVDKKEFKFDANHFSDYIFMEPSRGYNLSSITNRSISDSWGILFDGMDSILIDGNVVKTITLGLKLPSLVTDDFSKTREWVADFMTFAKDGVSNVYSVLGNHLIPGKKIVTIFNYPEKEWGDDLARFGYNIKSVQKFSSNSTITAKGKIAYTSSKQTCTTQILDQPKNGPLSEGFFLPLIQVQFNEFDSLTDVARQTPYKRYRRVTAVTFTK